MSIKVLVALGTRPEGIKLAPVIQRLQNTPEFSVKVLHTGQHDEMLQQVLDFFSIKIDFRFHIMKEGQTLAQLHAQALLDASLIFQKESFDLVIVQGDTTTAFAVSQAAFFHKIKIAHVEAGLRSFDLFHPFPEEANRKWISQIANISFAPTQDAYDQLLNEKIDPETLFLVGNTVVDALQQITSSFKTHLSTKKKILVTAHRRENFGAPFLSICEAIKELALRNQDVEIIYPVHLNPQVYNVAHSLLSGIKNITLLPPLPYQELLKYMHEAYFVLTDSGGIQEEAPSLGKPVLILREVTERPEGVRANVAKLVGSDKERILFESERLLHDKDYYASMSHAVNLYGDGKSSERIVGILLREFSSTLRQLC